MDERFAKWLASVEEGEKAELLAIKDDEREIAERFARDLEFGTAGMRGEVGMGTFRMNVYSVRRATGGLCEYISALGEDAKNRGVVISYDTRRFSFEFAVAVAEVLTAYGIKGYLFENVRPVPMCSFAVRNLHAVAGVMITASHNPKEYNGYKVYGEDGAQMASKDADTVVSYIDKVNDYFAVKYVKIDNPAEKIHGKNNVKINDFITVIGKDVDEKYYDTILKLSLSPSLTKEMGGSIKLVYTPVHGSGYIPVTTVFQKLGINAKVVEAQAKPDTEFSTVSVPNPENAECLTLGIELGNKTGADVVLATDPDCDRLGVAVRNSGGDFVLLNGNRIGVLLLDYIITRQKELGTLAENAALVKTIVTTYLADRIALKNGVAVFNVLTGFKYIGEKIKEWERDGSHTFLFGFEESYGSLVGTHARDKDAVTASMLFAEMLLYWESKGKSVYARLMEIFGEYGYYAEKNVSIAYKGLSGMEDMAKVMKSLRAKGMIKSLAGEEVVTFADYKEDIKIVGGVESKTGLPASDVLYYGMNDGQFVCVRPSGTEPKLKLYVSVLDKANEQNAIAKAEKILEAVRDVISD